MDWRPPNSWACPQPGVRLLQDTPKAKRCSARLYSRERFGGPTRLIYRRLEVCLGVTPIGRLRQVAPLAMAGGSKAIGVRAAWITIIETLKLATDALRAHKLRSFLTLLGVILAVTTLVFVMSVIAGLNLYVAERAANLGANVFIVDRFGIITSRDEFIKAQKRPLITMD